jgi:NADH dehydrogenase
MVLVVGATGQLGGTIARRLMAGGQNVRVLVRPATDAGAYGAGVCEIARGDLHDRASLDAACKGIATVVTTANSARRGGADTVDTVDLNGTRSLIEAAKAAGVEHFIYTSVLGVTPESPVPFLAAKARNEAHLKASGMTWTILAPNAFMESWPAMVVGMPAMAGKPVTIVGEGRRKHTFVSERDVASFGVTAVTHPAARNRHIPIGGPEGLSWRDAAAVYERVLGRPIEIRSVAAGTPIPGIPDVVLPFLAGLDAYESNFDAQPIAAEFGVRLTTLAEIAGAAPAHA